MLREGKKKTEPGARGPPPPPPPPPPLARSGTRRPPSRPAVALTSTPTSSLRIAMELPGALCRTPARAGVGSDENARPGGASTRAPAEPGAAYRPPLRAIQQIQPTRRAAGKTPARVGAVTTPLRPTNTPAPGKPKPVLRLGFSTAGATGAQLQRSKVPRSILLWEENHTVQQHDSDALAKEGNSSEHKLSLQLELDITKTILLEEVKARVEAEARAAAFGDELKKANICTLEACRQKEATKKELEVTISVLDLVEAKQVCLIKQIEELKKKRDQETLMLNTELQQEWQAMGEVAEAITSLINQSTEILVQKEDLEHYFVSLLRRMEEISEERMTYAEAKDKAIKLLEMSIEDADVTVCALEEKVKLLEEEAEQRKKLEVDLQHATQQLLVVPSCREAKSSLEKRMVDSPDPIRHPSNINYGVLHSQESRTGKEEACEVEGEGIKGPTTRIKRSARQLLLSFLKTASEEELQTLKGIREKRAKRILELREQSPEVFASVKDVLDSIEMKKPQVSNMMWDMMVGPESEW